MMTESQMKKVFAATHGIDPKCVEISFHKYESNSFSGGSIGIQIRARYYLARSLPCTQLRVSGVKTKKEARMLLSKEVENLACARNRDISLLMKRYGLQPDIRNFSKFSSY